MDPKDDSSPGSAKAWRHALFRAIMPNDDASLRALIAQGIPVDHPMTSSNFTPLMLAACDGRDRCLRALIELGADLSARAEPDPLGDDGLDDDGVGRGGGCTALHFAAREGWPNCVEALLEAGADPTAADEEGNTPLDLAVAPHPGDLGVAGSDMLARIRAMSKQERARKLRSAADRHALEREISASEPGRSAQRI